jgi:hypothetical protein
MKLTLPPLKPFNPHPCFLATAQPALHPRGYTPISQNGSIAPLFDNNALSKRSQQRYYGSCDQTQDIINQIPQFCAHELELGLQDDCVVREQERSSRHLCRALPGLLYDDDDPLLLHLARL